MVKNVLIARKTYRPREDVGMFIIKKCIYLNDRFRLALVKILTPEKYLKGECKWKKGKEWRKGEEKHLEGVKVAKSRWLETNYIQSQQTIPLFTEGRMKGSNVKSLKHFEMKRRM